MPNRPNAQSSLRYPLSTILANDGHVRVLRELSRHGGELYVSVIAIRTGLTPQGTRNVLSALVASGAVTMIGAGRSRLFRIGGHPVMKAVVELFAIEERAYVDAIDLVRTCVKACPGVCAAWIYGSTARGEDTPASDIDIAVVADDTEAGTVADDLRRALIEHSGRFPMPVSIVGLGTSDVLRLSTGDPRWAGLAKDALPIKGDRPDAFARGLAAAKSRRASDDAQGIDQDSRPRVRAGTP